MQLCKRLKPSQAFVAVLEYPVAISNYLNEKLGKKNAHGFWLSCLCRGRWNFPSSALGSWGVSQNPPSCHTLSFAPVLTEQLLEKKVCFQKPGNDVLLEAKTSQTLRFPPGLLQLLSTASCFCCWSPSSSSILSSSSLFLHLTLFSFSPFSHLLRCLQIPFILYAFVKYLLCAGNSLSSGDAVSE